jgi:predicted ATPase
VSEAEKPFVETVRIQNFGCARDVALELTRLHALIGPNDSGKSTVLAALRTACELIRVGEQALLAAGHRDPRGVSDSRITLGWDATEITYRNERGRWRIDSKAPSRFDVLAQELWGPLSGPIPALNGALLFRWDPDAIRAACELIPEGGSLTLGERGEGLPAIYDAILSRDRSAFDDIDAGVRSHFRTVKGIWVPSLSSSTKGLGVVLNDGTRVHASELSEGLLYWLAFAALPHIERPAMLLIEEPENGLHPSRIADVIHVLREISRNVQVILATHSPLVINELQPDEVTILTRHGDAGTRARRMDRTTHFQQRQQVYALGELWLSFADGVDEAALVADGDTKQPAG